LCLATAARGNPQPPADADPDDVNEILLRPAPAALLCAAVLACTGSALARVQQGAGSTRPVAVQAGGCGPANLVPTRSNVGFFAHITFCLINRQRMIHGLRALHENRALDRSARSHSLSMVAHGYFSHNSLDGGSPFQRMAQFGYPGHGRACALGENIAAGVRGSGTPGAIVGMWMRSAEHRANILNGSFRDGGMGVAYGFPGIRNARGATFTEDFGVRC
jgi:uncharacterized protein YkwD